MLHPWNLRLRRAFTLLELLVVIAIIAILAALLYPAIQSANAARNESIAISNMRQIGAAFILYAGENSYQLPGRISGANTSGVPSIGSPPGSADKWPALLSKYLGDVRVYAAAYDTQNYLVRNVDPLANNGNNTSYIMNGYNDLNAFNDPTVTVRINAFPSTVNVILLGTPIIGSRQYYMDFEEAPHGNENDVLWLNAFNGGSPYLFADGSARFISEADYNKPDPDNTSQSYGNDLWCVNKSYVIPQF